MFARFIKWLFIRVPLRFVWRVAKFPFSVVWGAAMLPFRLVKKALVIALFIAMLVAVLGSPFVLDGFVFWGEWLVGMIPA